jgi:transposase-like protein
MIPPILTCAHFYLSENRDREAAKQFLNLK